MSMDFLHGGLGTLFVPYIHVDLNIKGFMVIEPFEWSHPQHTVRGSPIERPRTSNRLNYDLRKLSNTSNLLERACRYRCLSLTGKP